MSTAFQDAAILTALRVEPTPEVLAALEAFHDAVTDAQSRSRTRHGASPVWPVGREGRLRVEVPNHDTELMFHEFEKLGVTRPIPGALSQLRRRDDDDGGGGDGGGGGGGGTGTATSGPPDPLPAEAFWWGFHIYVSHANIGWALGANGAAAAVGALAAVFSAIPVVQFIGWALAAWFFANLVVMSAMDAANNGRGVWISMLWVAPGIFVPTPV